MALINVIGFVVSNIFYNLVFMFLSLQITTDIRTLLESVQRNLTFIFIVFSDAAHMLLCNSV